MDADILEGHWVLRHGQLVPDKICERINGMIQHQLDEIGHDASGWFTLFRDKRDGQFWERSYPRAERHGGGRRCYPEYRPKWQKSDMAVYPTRQATGVKE